MLIDVFIDFSRVAVGFDIRAAIARLADAELLGAMANRVTCAAALDDVPPALPTPEGWSIVTGSPVEACRDALAAAGEDERPLLVLLGDVRPTSAAIGVLTEAAAADPMIGFASPRLTGLDPSSVARLDLSGDQEIDASTRRGPGMKYGASVSSCIAKLVGLIAGFCEGVVVGPSGAFSPNGA